MKVLAILLLSLLLSGCILQSRSPLFSDAEGEMLLAGYGMRFNSFSHSSGEWKPETEILRFMPEKGHYRANDGKADIDVTLVAVSDRWWAMQAMEPGKTAAYLLIESRKDALLFYPILCDALRKDGGFAEQIEFFGDDCFVKPGSDAKRLFAGLAAKPGPASMKLVPMR